MSHRLSALCVVIALPLAAHAVDVSGKTMKLPKVPADQSLRLISDTTFGYETGIVPNDIDLNGHTLTIDTGGGNRTELAGSITGNGAILWHGGGQDAWQTVPSFFSGKKPNSFTGSLTIDRGTLAFAKPAGTHAFAGGKLILGGGPNQAIVRLDASNQIADHCEILITGKHEGRIWTQGNSETLGSLDLQSHGTIDLGDGESKLIFADSSSKKWDLSKTLTIDRWTQGKDHIAFTGKAGGVTSEQLARIGFADPSGFPAGLYTAKVGSDGQLLPGEKVSAKSPPFDLSDEAVAARKKVYDVAGRAKLTGTDSALSDGVHVSFFGDSLTWQNAFIRRIQDAIAKGEGRKGKKIQLFNHGINGGGVLSIRDGSDKAAYVSEKNQDGPQASFAKVIAADKATVAVVMIGINDVWWRATKPEIFEAALRDIAKAASENKTKLVLATPSAINEKPDGTNAKDKAMDQFADITRKVAKETGVTLIDTRAVFIAYLQNHNVKVRVDGSLVMREAGVLTYDGVHPNDRGNDLLADHLAAGIDAALRGR